MAPSVTKFPISGGNNTAATWNSLVYEVANNKDFIASGLTPTDGGGLNLSVAAGVSFCAGVRHDVGSGTAVLGKSTTNYVFYDPTTLDYHVDTDNTKPTNAVWIATVTTDASAITAIYDRRVLAPYPIRYALPSPVSNNWTGTETNIDDLNYETLFSDTSTTTHTVKYDLGESKVATISGWISKNATFAEDSIAVAVSTDDVNYYTAATTTSTAVSFSYMAYFRYIKFTHTATSGASSTANIRECVLVY